MTRPAHDVYLIHVPDSTLLPRLAWRYDAVVRAMDELGKYARVLRITEGELCRDVTHNFQDQPALDYPEDGEWRRPHTRYMNNLNSFGKRR